MMLNIGCHLSSAKGFVSIEKNANSINANSFQYFTRNPRGMKSKNIDMYDINTFLEIQNEKKYNIVGHAPYILNLCSSNENIRNYSKNILKEDIQKVELISGNYYNLHPGSHTGQGIKIGINQISEAINSVIKDSQNVMILLETMTGKGSEIGGNFEEISEIISNITLKDKIGVCFDTCHVFDAGYDIVTNLENVIEKFNKVIGLKKLKVIHLNDSKNNLGSKKDRHEKIGQGKIGLEALMNIVNHKYLKDKIFILETPQENLEGYGREINLIKSYCKEELL